MLYGSQSTVRHLFAGVCPPTHKRERNDQHKTNNSRFLEWPMSIHFSLPLMGQRHGTARFNVFNQLNRTIAETNIESSDGRCVGVWQFVFSVDMELFFGRIYAIQFNSNSHLKMFEICFKVFAFRRSDSFTHLLRRTRSCVSRFNNQCELQTDKKLCEPKWTE